MSTSPSPSTPLPDEDGDGDPDPHGPPTSDPESARREAEDALAEIEALADLDEDVETKGPSSQQRPPQSESVASTDPPPEDQCENCGALLHGPYCSQCGQKAADRIVPIWHMLNEALEALSALDLRVLHTLPRFLFCPGRLTKEYIQGRRRRYIRPFRLYLFSTFVLFAVMALTTTGTVPSLVDPSGTAELESSQPTTETADSTSSQLLFGSPAGRKQRAKEIRSDSSYVDVDLYESEEANNRLETLLQEKSAQANENPRRFLDGLLDRGPYLMFVMLPIFALLLKLLFIRRGHLYVEHLIFSLHLHALTFIAFTVGLLLDQTGVSWLTATTPWIAASPVLYLILAMRHVYDQGLLKSTLKTTLLVLVYLLLMAIGFALLVLVSVLFM